MSYLFPYLDYYPTANYWNDPLRWLTQANELMNYLNRYFPNTDIDGTSAADNLNGTYDSESIYGFEGDDSLNGGTGIDTLIGGTGNDTYIIDSTTDTITELPNEGSDKIQSSVSLSIATVDNVENLVLTGTSRINGTGNSLNNAIIGNIANNKLNGGSGNDKLNGSKGDDILIGGAGKDNLTGGLGKDTFDFNAYSEIGLGTTKRDVITDFTRGQDKIDLSSIDPNTALAGNQAFKFITTPFNAPGQLHYSNGIISINTDTDSATEYEIQLTGVIPTTLAATDFVL